MLESAAMNRFVSTDGVHLSYYEWGTPNGSRPVVLHHGFAVDTTSNWVVPGIVDALLDAGHHVVGIDARGHGASDKPHDPAVYGENIMSRDLSILLDVLEYTEVDLIGYSMGGVVAAITATRDARVRRLILGGVGCAIVELGGVDRRVFEGTSVVDVLLTDDPAEIAGSPARAFRTLADAVGADRRALVAQLKAAHRAPIPLWNISAPTLVLAGLDDPLSTKPDLLAAAIPGARCVTVPGDHLSAVRAPEFASAIVEFFALAEKPAA
jgi:pimeloyl-ACP methyl ester carboxylesterase